MMSKIFIENSRKICFVYFQWWLDLFLHMGVDLIPHLVVGWSPIHILMKIINENKVKLEIKLDWLIL